MRFSFPLFEPLHLGARTAEEFHLHLLELSHSEYELSRDDLVSERLSDLGDTERNLHAARLLDVEIFNEYSLCRLRTQVDLVVRLAGVADLGREHQVELTHISPVLRAGNRIHDVAVKDDLLVLLEVVGLLGCNITVVNLVIFRLLPQNVRVSGAELLLVEAHLRTSCGPSRPPCSSSPRSCRDSPRSDCRRDTSSWSPCCR